MSTGFVGAHPPPAAGKDPKKWRELEGETIEDYQGDANGGGWRRWAETYLDANTQILEESRGPTLMLAIVEGSEAARIVRHLKREVLKQSGGEKLIFQALDARYLEILTDEKVMVDGPHRTRGVRWRER